jgi:ribosomal protein S18 acetylase RimI-like enzyme
LNDLEAGMKVRLATGEDVDDIAQVHVQSWQETYSDIFPARLLKGLSLDVRRQEWTAWLSDSEPLSGLLVATHNDELVGFCSFGKSRHAEAESDEAEVYAIYVLNHAQGQGIGYALWRNAIQALAEQGASGLVVEVLTANRACGFYETLHGQVRGRGLRTVAGIVFEAVVYEWPSVARALKD